MTFYAYSEWSPDKPVMDDAHLLDREKVEGFALHWPGQSTRIPTIAKVFDALRSYQAYHKSKGWSDIAYQIAVDQQGNVYQCRGIRYRSAANGDRDVNERFGAILLLVAEGERPSQKMIHAVNQQIERDRTNFYRNAVKVVGHKDIRPDPTTCPGPIVEQMIHDGMFHS